MSNFWPCEEFHLSNIPLQSLENTLFSPGIVLAVLIGNMAKVVLYIPLWLLHLERLFLR